MSGLGHAVAMVVLVALATASLGAAFDCFPDFPHPYRVAFHLVAAVGALIAFDYVGVRA